MKETLLSYEYCCERPELNYFHGIVSSSSIYLIKFRPRYSNLCHGAFAVCSCRLELDMVEVRKSFLPPRVWL